MSINVRENSQLAAAAYERYAPDAWYALLEPRPLSYGPDVFAESVAQRWQESAAVLESSLELLPAGEFFSWSRRRPAGGAVASHHPSARVSPTATPSREAAESEPSTVAAPPAPRRSGVRGVAAASLSTAQRDSPADAASVTAAASGEASALSRAESMASGAAPPAPQSGSESDSMRRRTRSSPPQPRAASRRVSTFVANEFAEVEPTGTNPLAPLTTAGLIQGHDDATAARFFEAQLLIRERRGEAIRAWESMGF